MGHNVSSVHGVKSSDIYAPGNAVNEIWVDNVELISRLPFGDSDLGQAGWPPDDWPKIPWHQFIIPLKRNLGALQNHTTAMETNVVVTCAINMVTKEVVNCTTTIDTRETTRCVTPLIFGVDSAWASLLFLFSVVLIEFGFFLLFLIAVMVVDGLRTLRIWTDCPLRIIPKLYQPQNVMIWARHSFKLSFYYLLFAIFSMSFGFPMATSAAPCLHPFEVFRKTMEMQGSLTFLIITIPLIYLGYSLWEAVKRRDGDEQDQAAETWLAQCPVNQPNIPAPSPHQSTSASADVEKAMESNFLGSQPF
ncbi:hypothetical protein N7481_000974 [Penicillium waksmanii]|uniref:uncharacterized protein n=1 Tax=Penicillium waksmanii TaxID=69791 RepID=UPI0025490F92|nr:uncharacterized protein N7481_000974 [Penicillium waksmanii]KAJ6000565.1 hypothetical protein N7481_000974 [Penicillium waksmanii]